MTIRYSRHPELRLTALAGEGVVLHLGTRRYFTVSESGLVILEALAAPCTKDELVAAVLARYEVDPSRAAASVESFLSRCRDADLLEEHEAP
ncbi:MAG TPA: PqqD family protein [Gemmatimonadales bacterium]|nr:PqqD family protein [Gemmatimonadales bacterium]